MLHTILLQIKVVKEPLRKQQEEKKYSEEKMAAYVETKARELREKPPRREVHHNHIGWGILK
jgi:hypothetical protein